IFWRQRHEVDNILLSFMKCLEVILGNWLVLRNTDETMVYYMQNFRSLVLCYGDQWAVLKELILLNHLLDYNAIGNLFLNCFSIYGQTTKTIIFETMQLLDSEVTIAIEVFQMTLLNHIASFLIPFIIVPHGVCDLPNGSGIRSHALESFHASLLFMDILLFHRSKEMTRGPQYPTLKEK
ncbi:hypothetical protein ACJX0J_039665, partial [Zea mays]